MSGGEALGDVPGGRDRAPFLQGRREGDSVLGGARKQITGVASSRWARKPGRGPGQLAR